MDEMFNLHDVLLIAIATIVGGGTILIVWIWMNRNSSSNNTASGDGDLSSKPRPSCIPPPGQDYEVFLRFRGEDTRKEFTDHLYNRLNDAGIWVFRDNEGLHVGEKIDPELMKAIQASKISIPIISPNYASSKWCLRELVQILECKKAGQIVLPIFYKVTPSDVRNQTGDFGKAFLMHQKKCSSNDIQEWRNTLKEVASLKGLESNKIADGHEGELVKTVLRKVLKKLKKANLVVDDHLIGVQEHVEKIIEMVHTKASDEVQVILIHGMGGIGKTTLAKLIYNQFSIDYDHRSFLPDIRERSSHDRGRVELQKQLISDILEQTSTEAVTNIDAGINIIKHRFKEKKVLILLDDVSHIDQLKALAKDRHWFKSGSLLIITSRNKDILKKWDKKLTYELNGLDPEQSFQLFRYHAFGRDNARQSELEHIAGEIVSTTGGLPLAIKVIGSLLFGEFKDIWEDTLKRLQETPDDEVMGKLRISYDSLKYEEHQIFLDIACFSFQYVENFAYYMWDSCRFHPHLHVKNLISLSLIKIEDNNRLVIHDQLRDLGMSIVRQESFYDLGKRSRLWDDEDAWEVLNEKQGTKKIEAISLVSGNESEVYSLTSEHFKDLTKLRFLYLEDISLNGDFDNLLPNLRWLHWVAYSCTPMETMPINFHPRKLAVLDLENIPITEHWSGWNQVEVVKKLKVVRLVGCKKLTTTPDFSSFKELEILIIRHCVNLIGIHPSICNIKKTLMTLEVSNCGKLEELPIEVGELEKLKNFTLYETSIREIPESIGSLVELHTLKLRSSYSLTKIPKSIGKLGSLSKLHLYLKRTEVPGSIGNLHNLEELCISNCPSLEKIIDLSGLKKLTKLELCGCGAESMGHLTSLEELLIQNCKSLQMINDLSHLKKLTRFHLTSCNMLIEVEGIGRLMSLKELSIENCKSLEVINDLSFLKKLEKLRLSDCDKLIGV